ncbi:MAG TPA: autotransporter-associated beta strand repeat-containing protein, partial [Luteolibacter sp.]
MKPTRSLAFLAPIFYALAASSAHGTTHYWDGGTINIVGDGDGASGGTAGDWSTGLSNWDVGVSPYVAWPGAGTDNDAVFGGTAGTVTLATAITANDLTFNTTGYTITNGTLTLNGTSPTITTGTGVTTTIGSAIAGSAGLQKSGDGTLILSNTTNSFSGGVALAGGTLQISAATNLPSGNTLTFTNGAILTSTAGMTLANNVVIAAGQSGTIKAPTSGLLTLNGNYSGVAGSLSLDLTVSSGFGGIAIGAATGPVVGSIVNVLGTTGANNTQIDLRPAGAVTFFKDTKVVISASGAGLTLFGLGNAGNGRNYQFGALDGGNATTQIQSDNASSTLTINGVT